MTTVSDTQVRDRLKAVREELREKRSERGDLKRERDAAKEAFGSADHSSEDKITDWPEFKAAEEATRKVGTVDDEIADLQQAETSILNMLGDVSDSNGNGSHPALELANGGYQGWDGARLVAKGSAYELAREAGAFHSTGHFGTIQLGEIASRDDAMAALCGIAPMFATPPNAPAGPVTSTGAALLIQQDRRGIQPTSLRPMRLLDLFPSGTTDSNSIEYVQVSAIPGTAAPVAEGAVKPEEGLTLVDATAPVRTIAGWIKVNRQAMADAAGLSTLINTLLPYDVRRKIEAQILTGDGTGQNLTGILATSGVNNPAAVGGDNLADATLRGMTAVILSEAEPNFAAFHPVDWQTLLLMREGTGATAGGYLYGGPATMAAPTIWGLRITQSVALTQGKQLVGDSMGATVLFREGVNVKTSDSDQDDFVRNRVTVLAEARVAFPVWRPSAFAIIDAT